MNAYRPTDDQHDGPGGIPTGLPSHLYTHTGALRPGPWPVMDVVRILDQMVQGLRQRHREGQWDGALRLDRFVVDASGGLQCWSDSAEGVSIEAPFECHAQDPAWPMGPWTDVYAICAMGHALITGQPPPDAWDALRRTRTIDWPEAVRATFPQPLLQGLAQGLAFDGKDRPADLDQFVRVAGLSALLATAPVAQPAAVPQPPPLPQAVPTPQASPLPQPSPPSPPTVSATPSQRETNRPTPIAHASSTRPSRWPLAAMTLTVIVLLGVIVWMWLDQARPWRDDVVVRAPTPSSAAAIPPAPAAPAPLPMPPDLPGLSNPSGALSPLDAPVPDDPPSIAPAPVDTTPGIASEGPLTPPPVPDRTNVDSLPAPAPADPASAAAAQAQPDTPPAAAPGSAPSVASETSPAPVPVPSAAPVAVSVAIEPWGEVFVNGTSRGISPPLRALRLAPGTYRVTIRNPNMPPHSTSITVAPGKGGRISHRFQ